MAGIWNAVASALFKPKDEAERLKKENARIDKEIESKKLEIKKIKITLRNHRKEKFHKKMEKMPAKVKLVNIEGLLRTSDELVMHKVQQLFHVNSFQEIIETSKEIHKNLKSLGCFKKVNMSVDTMPEDPTHYKVNITVEEAGSLFGNIGIVCGTQNQVAGIVRAGVNNVVGAGERAEVELSKGWGGYFLTNLSLRKPLHWLPLGSHAAVFARTENLSVEHFHSSVAENALGAALSISAFSSAVKFVSELKSSWLNTKHNFQHLAQPGVAKWDPLAQCAGHALRSSLATKLCLDLRDDPLLPAHGLLFSAGHQVSVNHCGQHAHKMTVSSSLHYPLFRGLSLSLRSLLSHTWGSYSPHPQELPHYRSGLQARGMNIPKEYQGDPTNFISILAVTSNLPLLTANSLVGRHVKFHTFLTVHSSKVDSIESLLLKNISPFFGVGFVGKIFDLGRFELNFCVPINYIGGQGGNKPGLRFSLGTDFL